MTSQTVLRYLLPLPLVGVFIALTSAPLAAEDKPGTPITRSQVTAPLPPYVQKGNEVDARYRVYTERLKKFYEGLKARLAVEAPDLVKKLRDKSPKPVAYGYQIVPRLVADKPSPEKPSRVTSTSFSWGRTERFIDGDLKKLTALKEILQKSSERPAPARRPINEKMVTDYNQLEDNQRLIDHHVQYNRFWQNAIASEPARYDRLTRQHDAVLERQEIRDRLKMAIPADTAEELRTRRT